MVVSRSFFFFAEIVKKGFHEMHSHLIEATDLHYITKAMRKKNGHTAQKNKLHKIAKIRLNVGETS